jgi:hypothetical protein
MVKNKMNGWSGEGRGGAGPTADIPPDVGLTPIHLVSYQQRCRVNSDSRKVKGREPGHHRIHPAPSFAVRKTLLLFGDRQKYRRIAPIQQEKHWRLRSQLTGELLEILDVLDGLAVNFANNVSRS